MAKYLNACLPQGRLSAHTLSVLLLSSTGFSSRMYVALAVRRHRIPLFMHCLEIMGLATFPPLFSK